MIKRLLLGNEAIALGAIRAGVQVAAAYPGTPSSEIVGSLVGLAETGGFYAEWSVNEKVALEVAAGAAFAGAKALCAMKQVGLNVAADPLMSLAYLGIPGALVVMVADDPGPHSSQTEQDTRTFAGFAKLPVFDPSSPEEAYEMAQAAFALSASHGLPVILRPTTRVCHAAAAVEVQEAGAPPPAPVGFKKDPRWVIMPRLSYERHRWLEAKRQELAGEFARSPWNFIIPGGRLGVITGGVSYHYVREAVSRSGIEATILKVGTPHPLPEALIQEFLAQVDAVLAVEELDPVLEDGLALAAFRAGRILPIYGKRRGQLPYAGEYTPDLVEAALRQAAGEKELRPETPPSPPPSALPVRAPVLCAGCPHRASFYAAKAATKGADAIYTGDIGCYTLGNAAPLSMVDTCLCMGAGLSIAAGLAIAGPDRPVLAFIGDSTFFHSGIPGVINAVFNQHPVKFILLDNATTAMTGHQTHPGLGRTAMGRETPRIDPEQIALACGLEKVCRVDPLDHLAAVAAVREAMAFPGPAMVIMTSPCTAQLKTTRSYQVDAEACVDCGRCLRELGCPAMAREGKPIITMACSGCGLCAQICAKGAIKEAAR